MSISASRLCPFFKLSGISLLPWQTETLYCGEPSKHTCCSVPAACWGLAMGGVADQGVEGAVPLPHRRWPSSLAVQPFAENLFFSFCPLFLCFLRSWQLHRSALSLTGGIMVLLQSEEKGLILIFRCGSEKVGCQVMIRCSQGVFLCKIARHRRQDHQMSSDTKWDICQVFQCESLNPKLLLQQIKVSLRRVQFRSQTYED